MHDVERYRGSCLIVSKPGNGGGQSAIGGRSSRSQQHQDGSGQGPHRHLGSGGNIPAHSSGNVCQGGTSNNNVSSIDSGGSALTGMPLFSFMHQRRSSCRSVPRSQQQHYNNNQNLYHQFHQHQNGPNSHRPLHHHHHSLHNSKNHSFNSGNDVALVVDGEEIDDLELLPLAQLALHTHGHPLILTPRGGTGARGNSAPPAHNRNNYHIQNHTQNTNDHQQNYFHRSSPQQTASTASESISVTSDEGSIGQAENILPRIIKPRKRRKKDRKPTPSSPPPVNQTNVDDVAGTIVTLKPYMPMCYNYNKKDSKGQSDRKQRNETTPNNGCGCEHCVTGQVFPTPPPSPASSASSSSTVISSSCSSSSEDEPSNVTGAGFPTSESGGSLVRCSCKATSIESCSYHHDGNGDNGKQLVRSLSEPQPRPTLHISSSISDSFAGHRDLDIRFVRSNCRDIPITSTPPSRTRHWSVPATVRSHPLNGQQSHFLHQNHPFTGSVISPDFLGDGQMSYQEYAVTTPQPPLRPWLHLVEPDRSKPACIFTVMCYNVLCDKYATRQMYGYCPRWALDWGYRKKGIMNEIRHYLADIITLQEVETDQFFNFFLPELKNEGYDGIFSPKSRAKHMTENERKYVDGCAIFWRTAKFTLVKERLIEFNQLAMANHDGSEDMLNRVMTKDNIGLAALLETKEGAWENSIPPDKSQINQPILVCTAHIHWDPEFRDVKLIQTIMLISEIRQIITQIVEEFQHRVRAGRKLDPNAIQLLLCGDLNSLPESGVVEFLTKGNVAMDHEDFKGFDYKTGLTKIAMANNSNPSLVNTNANIYSNSFRLATAYDFSTMAYTNYTYEFKGVIDYIFHEANTMTALGVLGPIDPDWFSDHKVVGCPHPHIPSDHFPLLVQLEMRPVQTTLSHPNGLLHR